MDITQRADIEQLMLKFYEKALKDAVIGHYFTEVVQLNLEKHIPVIVDFWEMVLLDGHGYTGNPMLVHQELHRKAPFENLHFDRWLALFNETVNELFAGNNAIKIQQRALSLATVMKTKTIYGGIGTTALK